MAFLLNRPRIHLPRHRTLLISEPSYDRFHRVAIGYISIMESFLNMSSLLLMPVHHFWCKNSEGQDIGFEPMANTSKVDLFYFIK